MPPKKKTQPEPAERRAFLEALAAPLIAVDQKAIAAHGRAPIRRLNRFEYENTLREVLDVPLLLVADGGFRHGQHLAFDQANNTPLPNLFVSILQGMGIEADHFASSTGTLSGLDLA